LKSFVAKKKDLDEDFIKDLHRIILQGIDDLQAGVYRKTNVRILGSVHIPPNPIKIPTLINDFLTWYKNITNTKYQNPNLQLGCTIILFAFIHLLMEMAGHPDYYETSAYSKRISTCCNIDC
jgi:Fic family protein